MSIWQRWLQQPQRVWLRRAIFQVHLWTGLALGLYIVVLSATGSALVYRRELVARFRTPVPAVDQTARRNSRCERSEKSTTGASIRRAAAADPCRKSWSDRRPSPLPRRPRGAASCRP